MEIYAATVGKRVEIPMFFGASAGITLADLDALQALDGLETLDLEEDLLATFEEISGVPGYYLLSLTTRRAGSLYVRLQEGVNSVEFVVQSTVAGTPSSCDPSLEGDHTLLVEVGGNPIPGVTVRVYDNAGTTLVARGITNSAGEVTFALEAGPYQARFNKSGIDFTASNPSLFTVIPNSETTPRLDEIVPSTAVIGDTVALLGQFFPSEECEVLFSTLAAVPVGAMSTSLRALVVEVPAGLTGFAIPVRVRKPDPSNPGSYLTSNVVTLTRSL